MNSLITSLLSTISIQFFFLTSCRGALQCPCSFMIGENLHGEETYQSCFVQVPIATGGNYSLRGVVEACKNMKASVATVEKHEDAVKLQWPPNMLYFVGKRDNVTEKDCAYLEPDGDDPKGNPPRSFLKKCHTDDEDGMLDVDFLELVLCESRPWENAGVNCTCACGFFKEDEQTCVGGFAACSPISNYTAIHTICYALNSTVAYPARLPKEAAEPPAHWPNETVFFVGDPYIMGKDREDPNEDAPAPQCGFKNMDKGGAMEVDDCDKLLNFTDFFGVLCYGYRLQLTGQCPRRPRGAKCDFNSAYKYQTNVLQVGAIFLLAVVTLIL